MQAFESPHTHSNCFSFLRQYAEDSFSRAACLVTPKCVISFPQVTQWLFWIITNLALSENEGHFKLAIEWARMDGIGPYLVHITITNIIYLLTEWNLVSFKVCLDYCYYQCTMEYYYIMSYIFGILQVWKGQGSRKWSHGQHDGFFVQFESPFLRKLWFIPSSNEQGQTLCRSLSSLSPLFYSLIELVLASTKTRCGRHFYF